MLSKIITAVGIGLSFGGTIFTLWKTIWTNKKYVGTVNEIVNRKGDFAKEKKCVKYGVVMIAIGAGLQILGLFL